MLTPVKALTAISSLPGWDSTVGDISDLSFKRAQELAKTALETIETQESVLLAALQKIAAIENREFGSDWEEIEEARQIANDAIRLVTGER